MKVKWLPVVIASMVLLALSLTSCTSTPSATPVTPADSEITELERQLASLQGELESKRISLEELQSQNDQKTAEIEKLKAEVDQKTERISNLESNITQLENQIATQSEAIPEPAPLGKQWEIISIDAKVTEKNPTWWKNAWILVIKNNSPNNLSFDATIEFLDADGFVVDDDRAYDLRVNAGEQETFTGYALVDASVASNIKQVNAKVRES